MKIVWLSNSPWSPSGYGEQANLFVPRLKALGHEVVGLCNFGLSGGTREWDGTTWYPADTQWGNKHLPTILEQHNADLAIILHDAWVMKPHEWPDGPPVAVWTPVDHYPIPPAVLAVLSHERIRPIAMSRFGEQLMSQAGLNPCYVPHGIETRLFCPRPEMKAQVRERLGIPADAFLVGMVAANKGNPSVPRKAFPQCFAAWSRFAQEHEDVWMYAHTEAVPDGSGINLDVLATATNCPKGRLRFPPNEAWHIPQPREVIAVLYQAFDVLLHSSMGEGFGIPALEAQASGLPVIASRHSAMTELTGAGWLVDGDPWWDALQSSYFINPSIDNIYAALKNAYQARGDQELSSKAVEFAQAYDADRVMLDYWAPALEKLAGPREAPPLRANRAMRRAAQKRKVAA